MIELRCENCKKLFFRKSYAVEKSLKRNQHYFYCSRECQHKNWKGNPELQKYSGNRLDELSPYKWYIRVSKYRDKIIDLTPEYLKGLFESQSGKCVYTRVPLQLWDYRIKGGNNKIYTASLDRIDSTKDYVKGNVQFISMAANFFKHTMSHEETLEFCKIIANNYNNLGNDIVH